MGPISKILEGPGLQAPRIDASGAAAAAAGELSSYLHQSPCTFRLSLYCEMGAPIGLAYNI